MTFDGAPEAIGTPAATLLYCGPRDAFEEFAPPAATQLGRVVRATGAAALEVATRSYPAAPPT